MNRNIEWVYNKLNSRNINIEVLDILSWNKTKSMISTRCNNCSDIITSRLDNILYSNNSVLCKVCRYNSLNDNNRSTISHILDIIEPFKDEYRILDIDNYKNYHTRLKFKHLKCNHIYLCNICNFKNGNRCPKCNNIKNSTAILNIIGYLKNHNITYMTDYTIAICRNKRLLPFDIFIPSLNLIIEYDGSQHFHTWNNLFKRETVINDHIKNNFIVENTTYNFIRFSYKHDLIILTVLQAIIYHNDILCELLDVNNILHRIYDININLCNLNEYYTSCNLNYFSLIEG
jgi:hypothetical protein